MKRKKCPYDFVEVMACPSGCLNGGAQCRPEEGTTNTAAAKEQVARLKKAFMALKKSRPEDNDTVDHLTRDWLDGNRENEKASAMLHTSYHEVEKMTNSLAIKW